LAEIQVKLLAEPQVSHQANFLAFRIEMSILYTLNNYTATKSIARGNV